MKGQAIAVLKENTAETICRKCKSNIVLSRDHKTIATLAMCPVCGAGIHYIWKK